jgi:hypothetical protein
LDGSFTLQEHTGHHTRELNCDK